jgi:hypothetical protein
MKHISEIITDTFIDHMIKDATRGWEHMQRADETLPPPNPPMEELNQQMFIEQWVEENNRIKTVQVQENHKQKEKNVSIKRPTNRTAIASK